MHIYYKKFVVHKARKEKGFKEIYMAIVINYDGEKYTLGYTRATIRNMEKAGFNISNIDTATVTTCEDLFAGAFLMRHRRTKADKISEIYKHIEHKEELIAKLAEMYYEALSTLMEEPDENDSKKATWEEE